MSVVPSILVVDDDLNILEVLQARLGAAGFKVLTAGDGYEALHLLGKEHITLLVSDMKMPEMNGMDLLERAREKQADLPVIFLTAYGTIPDAVQAVKAGAVDYISKPFDGKELVEKIKGILGVAPRAEKKNVHIDGDGFFWGKSSQMQELQEIVKRVAASSANVLILGKSGVGKECIARMIHALSSRSTCPYVIVDCGSTPPGILESELFGHVKGAFTNADKDKPGLIETANGGTLFLDEIGNISAEMQSRLLRFLEERKIRRVGAVKEKDVDCRVISATNADLKASIRQGEFREDLFYRLRVVTLVIPELKERREDIPALARHFVEQHCAKQGIEPISLADETLEWLVHHDWPGNVRELKNCLEAGVVLCRGKVMYLEDLQVLSYGEDASPDETQQDEPSDQHSFSMKSSERDAIIRALKETGGVQKRAAELLDISRRSIHYKIKKYNISASDFK